MNYYISKVAHYDHTDSINIVVIDENNAKVASVKIFFEDNDRTRIETLIRSESLSHVVNVAAFTARVIATLDKHTFETDEIALVVRQEILPLKIV